MIESLHTAGFWSEIFEPFRAVGSKIADWFTPISEASSDNDVYKVILELPGVKTDDIDIALHYDTLTIKGDKYSERSEEKRAPTSSVNANMELFKEVSNCHLMFPRTTSKLISRMVR
jgi:HSP20 family molecular chaperone IbpA